MAAISGKENNIDVICMHGRDGSIMPIKIRVVDEDGAYQTYMIRGYKDLTNYGKYSLGSGTQVTNHIWKFECRILVFEVEKKIVLMYNAYDNRWRLMDPGK